MIRKLARVANCQNVNERRPQDEARLALTKPSDHGLPDIVFFSEIAWLLLAELCDDIGGWHAIQHGSKGSPEAGVGIAARVKLEPLGLLVGSKATAEGEGGVRMRPIVGARAWGLPWWAVHAPPPDSPRAREEYIHQARFCAGTLGGDWNQEPDWMRATTTRAYRGNGVLGIIAPRARQPGHVAAVDIDSDHPAIDVPLWIPERRLDRVA